MAVKILIKRKFKKATIENVAGVLSDSRRNAMSEQGYISSETWCDCNDSDTIIVVSMWHTMEDWERYQSSPHRKETEEKYAELLEKPAEYEFYNLGLPVKRRYFEE